VRGAIGIFADVLAGWFASVPLRGCHPTSGSPGPGPGSFALHRVERLQTLAKRVVDW
jgi:hypothetical protein